MDSKVKYFTQQWQPMTPMHCSNMCSNHQWQCFESLQSSLVGAFFMSYLCHISALLLCPNSVSLALPLVYQRFCQDPLDNLQTLPYQTSLSPHPRKQQSCNYCPLSDLCWRSPKLSAEEKVFFLAEVVLFFLVAFQLVCKSLALGTSLRQHHQTTKGQKYRPKQQKKLDLESSGVRQLCFVSERLSASSAAIGMLTSKEVQNVWCFMRHFALKLVEQSESTIFWLLRCDNTTRKTDAW